jgi:hypothetical protein
MGGSGSVLEHKTHREILDEAAAQGSGWIKVRLIDVKRAPELLDAAHGQERGSPELRDLSAMADLLEAARTSTRRRAPECFPSFP